MISRYLLRNPQIVWLMLIAIGIAGIASLSVMPRLEDPILKQRVGVVSVALPGAGTSDVEATVTQPLERLLQQFSEIQQVRSNSRAGVTNVVIELAGEVTDPAKVWAAIQQEIQSSKLHLPDGSSEPELTVFPLKAFAAILAITPVESSDEVSPDSSPDPLRLVNSQRLARELRNRLLSIDGTEVVEIFGATDELMEVKVTPKTLAATGLSPALIAQQISESQSLPGGRLRNEQANLPIQLAQSDSLQSTLDQLQIELPGRLESVRLSEIATVSRTVDYETEAAIVDGRDAIVLGVMVDDRQRVDVWTKQMQQQIDQLVRNFGQDFRVDPIFLQSDQIESRMNSLVNNLLLGTAAVIVVVFLMMGWRCMLVIAMSLPLAACMVLCGLRWMEIPIHQMSVTGLIVALGLLIDNAIVMVEEVRSRIYEGKSSVAAVNESVRHLGMPLLGSTLTTVLAFWPIATMPGPSGEFVGSIAVSVILAIGSSLVLAMTVVPPMVSLLGVSAERDRFLNYGIRFDPLKKLYRRSLVFTFRFPILGVLLGMTLPAIGFFVAGQLPRQFFPATDRAQIQIELERSASSTIQSVRKSVEQVSKIVAANESVSHQHWFLGKSAPTFYYNVVPRRRSSPTYAQSFVDLQGEFDPDRLVNELQAQIDANIFDARVTVRKLEQGPPFDAPIEVRVLGEDTAELNRIGDIIRQRLSVLPAVTYTRSDLGDTAVTQELDVDEVLADRAGVSSRDLSRMLHANSEGASAGSFFDRQIQIPVKVRVDYQDRSLTETLLAATVVTNVVTNPRQANGPAGSDAQGNASGRGPANAQASGRANQMETRGPPPRLPLGSLGDFKLSSDVGAIIRLEGRRINEVKAYLDAGVLPSVTLDLFKAQLAEDPIELPVGYQIEFGGEVEKRSQAISTLIANVVVLVIIVILILVAVMRSFRLALIVAMVGGLTIGLGPLALYGFGYPLGFMSIVGTMGLVGIAINDSIVVLSAIRSQILKANESTSAIDETPVNELVHDNQTVHHNETDANHETVHHSMATTIVDCTRHVLTTTLTTMVGFVPLVIGGGRFWPPLAIVIAAGVGGATILALYFAPSLFLIFYRIKR